MTEHQLTVAIERSAMEYQEVVDERINKAEQQLVEANRRADEATKQMGEIRVREEARVEQLSVAIARAEGAEQEAAIIAKRSEELIKEGNERLLASIARAEKAERHSAEKIIEAEKRIQKALESAAQLEQKFMDAMKRIEGSTGMLQCLNLDLADTHTQTRWTWMTRRKMRSRTMKLSKTCSNLA
jgi:chromosome segregation ATPase